MKIDEFIGSKYTYATSERGIGYHSLIHL